MTLRLVIVAVLVASTAGVGVRGSPVTELRREIRTD